MMISGGVKLQLRGAKSNTVVPLEGANGAFLDQDIFCIEMSFHILLLLVA